MVCTCCQATDQGDWGHAAHVRVVMPCAATTSLVARGSRFQSPLNGAVHTDRPVGQWDMTCEGGHHTTNSNRCKLCPYACASVESANAVPRHAVPHTCVPRLNASGHVPPCVLSCFTTTAYWLSSPDSKPLLPRPPRRLVALPPAYRALEHSHANPSHNRRSSR